MGRLYNEIMEGLEEALEVAKGNDTGATRRKVYVEPIKQYSAEEVKNIRKTTGFTQRLFAHYLGVSGRTVEAWEAGRNRPSGVASRLLSIIERDGEAVQRFPFVQIER